MNYKHLIILLFSLSLMSCGGGGSDTPKEPPPTPATPPVVTLSVDSASIDENSTIVITHSAKDYQDTTITSKLSCDVGTLDGNNYNAPSVATETAATCIATATDSGNRTSSESIELIINTVTPVLTLDDTESEIATAKIIILNVEYALLTEGILEATFDGEPIALAKVNDSQLGFILPVVEPGNHSLIAKIENELVILSFSSQAVSVPWTDSSEFINVYLQDVINNLDQLDSFDGAPLDLGMVEELRTFLNPDGVYFSSLTENDKELLAYLIYQNTVYLPDIFATKNVQNNVKRSKVNLLSSDGSCAVLGGTAKAIESTTIAVIALLPLTGPLSVPATAGLVIVNIANYQVIYPAAERACTRAFNSVINKFSTEVQNGRKVQNSSLTNSVKSVNALDFFSNHPEKLLAKREYEIIEGNEQVFQALLESFNAVAANVRTFTNFIESYSLPLIGKITVPSYIKDYFASDISFEDIRYKEINPAFLTVSPPSDSRVRGGITDTHDDYSFDMTFTMSDLTVPDITFNFNITDSGEDTPLNSTIDAEVTLNPPTAFDGEFAAIIGQDLIGQLEADFEIRFVIKTPPSKGSIDMQPPFDEAGIYTYIPDETITEDTTDSFTFVAVNGSSQNNGESNEATVTIEVAGRENCSTYNSLVEGKWEVLYYDGTLYELEVFADGTGEYTFPDDKSRSWPMYWSIVESDKPNVQDSYPNPISPGAIGVEKYRCVMIDNGFFNKGVADGFRSSLTRTLNEFVIYNGYDFSNPDNNPVYPETPYTVIYTKK